MGDLVRRESLFSTGFETRTAVGLSWIDRDLKAAAHSASLSLIEARTANRHLAELNWTAGAIAHGVHQLLQSLGLELAAQTELLGSQAASLLAIESAVTSPRRTEALERVAQASTLLDQSRFEPALRCARDAIDADPTNPHAFTAAAWAATALGDYEAAQRAFEDAIAASTGAARIVPARQAARLAYASGGAHRARDLLEDAIADGERDHPDALYDLALYCAATGDPQLGSDRMRAACAADTRFGMMALVDKALADFPELVTCAVAVSQETVSKRAAELAAAKERLAELNRHMPRPNSDWGDAELDTWRTALSDADANVARALELEPEIQGHRDTFKAELARITDATAQLESLLPSLGPLSRELTNGCRVRTLIDLLGEQPADWITTALTTLLGDDETIEDAAIYSDAEAAGSRPTLWSDEDVQPIEALNSGRERILLFTNTRLLWTTLAGPPVHRFGAVVERSVRSIGSEVLVERAVRGLPYENMLVARAAKKRKLELTPDSDAPTISFKIARWSQAEVEDLAGNLDALLDEG